MKRRDSSLALGMTKHACAECADFHPALEAKGFAIHGSHSERHQLRLAGFGYRSALERAVEKPA